MRAAWLGGSDATGRTDALSDVDLQWVVDPERTDDAFARIEGCLDELGGIADRFETPLPTDPPYRQRFYRPVGAPEHLMVDFCAMRPDRLGPFLDPDRHGQPVVLCDPEGLLAPSHDPATAARRAQRLAVLQGQVPMWAHLPGKALVRGQVIEAAAGYQRFVLGPLVELLRMRYCAVRFDFGFRYLPDDLPRDVVERLERLALAGSAEELGERLAEARAWLEAELEAASEGE